MEAWSFSINMWFLDQILAARISSGTIMLDKILKFKNKILIGMSSDLFACTDTVWQVGNYF